MQTSSKYAAVVLLGALCAVAVFMVSNTHKPAQILAKQQAVQNSLSPSLATKLSNVAAGQVAGASISTVAAAPKLMMPISIGLVRVNKKPFGLFVTPDNSPVDDDIFYGYHTGIDFETFPDEQNTDVAVTAACDGSVLLKQWAKGYGGVLVQSCQIDGEDVTIIYGHLKLESIALAVGQTLLAGDQIGYLGQGLSHETDGRRKHLHFDIHQGAEINVLGYVPTEDDLANWLDPVPYLE